MFLQLNILYAAERGLEKTLRFLILRKANVNQEFGADRTSALQRAAAHGHWKICELLLNAGADKSWTGIPSGKTAAQWAAEQGHKELAAFIESWGRVCS